MFHLGQMENLLFLGVPILKHIRVHDYVPRLVKSLHDNFDRTASVRFTYIFSKYTYILMTWGVVGCHGVISSTTGR